MNAHLASHQLQIEARHARLAETTPGLVRTTGRPLRRRAQAAMRRGVQMVRVGRAVVVREPRQKGDELPALLGRHLRPGLPPR